MACFSSRAPAALWEEEYSDYSDDIMLEGDLGHSDPLNISTVADYLETASTAVSPVPASTLALVMLMAVCRTIWANSE